MPELPEVETVRGGLEKLIVGKQVLSVECLCEKSLPVSSADVRQIIVGRYDYGSTTSSQDVNHRLDG